MADEPEMVWDDERTYRIVNLQYSNQGGIQRFPVTIDGEVVAWAVSEHWARGIRLAWELAHEEQTGRMRMWSEFHHPDSGDHSV